MQINYIVKRKLKRQLYTTPRLNIKSFCRRRSISFVRNDPMNEDFSFSVDDNLKYRGIEFSIDIKIIWKKYKPFITRHIDI